MNYKIIQTKTEFIIKICGDDTVVKKPANGGDPGSTPGSGRPLEEEMATHSGVVVWRIPWTEEPGGLQSTGSQSPTQLSKRIYIDTHTHESPEYIHNSEENT